MVTRRRLLRAGAAGLGAAFLGACSDSPRNRSTGTAERTSGVPLTTLSGFEEFADTVKVVSDGEFWLVESNGLPAHNMMVGITSWQQQVPVSQPYTGTNAWRIPSAPALADEPVSGKTALYRGAIALAVNGVPIFNALNNRGDDAYLAGELDKWGGHAGRGDDYHYHIAPLHLQDSVGKELPIAYALDGYPVYGETEPDGSTVTGLDRFNGHESPDGTYHYHGTRTYPYINGGLRGVVSVVDDQVDPQPVTTPFRPAQTPLAGATITGFKSATSGSYRLEYSLDGATGEVAYTVTSSSVHFTFTDPQGTVTTETYAREGTRAGTPGSSTTVEN
ncbi:YHYH protein [Streptomyces sp. MUM 136J]|nr:YHYH protein [Streptomyces sp. MUM 2J]MCH0572429.1 YHYH protein [Streptomyces sp. MUM 136J]